MELSSPMIKNFLILGKSFSYILRNETFKKASFILGGNFSSLKKLRKML